MMKFTGIKFMKEVSKYFKFRLHNSLFIIRYFKTPIKNIFTPNTQILFFRH